MDDFKYSRSSLGLRRSYSLPKSSYRREIAYSEPIGKATDSIKEEDKQCWQSELTTRDDRLAALYNLSEYSDLTITFPGELETLQVHRLVLAMSSPVLGKMLFGAMAEGNKLELPDDPPDAFKWLMQYIYCGATSFEDVETAVKVYRLAHKYQMNALTTLCSQYLRVELSAYTLPRIYDTAILLEDECLVSNCKEIWKNSAEKVLASSSIKRLTSKSMLELLNQDFRAHSEVAVFDGLVKWSGKKNSPEYIRKKIQAFLPLVRFLTMTLDEFVGRVMPSGVLSDEESAAILMNIKKVGNKSLPRICSKIEQKRYSTYNGFNTYR